MTEGMRRIKETLCDEVEKYKNKERLSATDVEMLHMLTDTVKNIMKIDGIEENGYSMGDWTAEGSYRRGRGGRDYSVADDRMDIRDRIGRMMDSNALSPGERSVLHEAYENMGRRR